MCYEYFCGGISYCKSIQQQMLQKVRPTELHRVNHKACPNFKFFNHRCEESICDRHMKVDLDMEEDDWSYEGDVDTRGDEEENVVTRAIENQDIVIEEGSQEENETMFDDIEYEESRKKVLQWFKKNDELERMNNG
jgi:hypothetical protein